MSKRVEIEQKFYCNNHEKLLEIINKNNLKKCSEKYESDEYFTDINSIYIKNRTCLRIRNVDNKYLELTFKGKSKELTNNYAKIENNINLDISNYDSIVGLLYSLGYFSYSVVNKNRTTYTKKVDDFEYNVMIDKIENLGDFVEFELLYYKDEKDIDYLQKELNEFVEKFKCLNFESANLPYRDFVANKTYINVLPQNKLSAILFDLDGTLIDSEQKFFESFRHVISLRYNYNISYDEYESFELKQNAKLIINLKNKGIIDERESDEIIMRDVYLEYEKKFMDLLDKNEVSLNFELLKQLKNKGLRLALVSTSRKKFIDMLLAKLNIENLFEIVISREDVKNLKPSPDAYIMALNQLNISSDCCIAFEDSERGIVASKKANIKTIQVNDFIKDKTKSTEISEKLSRILLSIINFI
ncbi:MAG: class IV adenylate cyclase [Tenericutes bacterium]|nr:class IV adenylate cyclase [Mycoplasmatota bacterium]